jgi:hypothetical protein
VWAVGHSSSRHQVPKALRDRTDIKNVQHVVLRNEPHRLRPVRVGSCESNGHHWRALPTALRHCFDLTYGDMDALAPQLHDQAAVEKHDMRQAAHPKNQEGPHREGESRSERGGSSNVSQIAERAKSNDETAYGDQPLVNRSGRRGKLLTHSLVSG